MIPVIRKIQRRVERTLHDSKGMASFGRWVSPTTLSECMPRGREVVREINPWLPPGMKESALFDYGVPDHIASLLDAPYGDEPTNADFLVAAMARLDRPGRFLEIGTSVGKTVFHVMKVLGRGHYASVDIEALNPAMLPFLEPTGETQTWPSPPDSVLPMSSTLTGYRVKDTEATFDFIRGDMLDRNMYSHLGGPYDVFFFDALKTGPITIQTLEMLDGATLIGDQFLMLWNDTGDGMRDSLDQFAAKLSRAGRSNVQSEIIYLRGWVGVHEFKHRVGVLTNWTKP